VKGLEILQEVFRFAGPEVLLVCSDIPTGAFHISVFSTDRTFQRAGVEKQFINKNYTPIIILIKVKKMVLSSLTAGFIYEIDGPRKVS
jgi:hypothetical protein